LIVVLITDPKIEIHAFAHVILARSSSVTYSFHLPSLRHRKN